MPDEKTTFQKIGDAVADFAPGLAGVLAATGVGAPAAAAVGAIGAIAKMFGLGSGATPEQVQAAIAQDPQAALKLRLAEMDFQLQLRKQDTEDLRVQMTPYLKELDTKTVPWVDALHKMARIILSFTSITATVILMMTGHSITPEAALLLGGTVTAYTLIKGKGNATAP